MIYGYARAGADGQTFDAQIAALKAARAEEVFGEKQAGAKLTVPPLARASAALESAAV